MARAMPSFSHDYPKRSERPPGGALLHRKMAGRGWEREMVEPNVWQFYSTYIYTPHTRKPPGMTMHDMTRHITRLRRKSRVFSSAQACTRAKSLVATVASTAASDLPLEQNAPTLPLAAENAGTIDEKTKRALSAHTQDEHPRTLHWA